MRRRDLALDDVPFLGMVGWLNSFYAFDDRNFTGFEWLIGWVGDLTQGNHLQRLGHRLSGARRPRGWRHQLDNEPVLNIFYARKYKFVEQGRFDAAVSVDAALGNYFSHGQAGLEMRFGSAPGGFAYVATPVGKGLQYDADLRQHGATYTYVSLVTAVTRVLHAMPRDGNVLRRNNAWTEARRGQFEQMRQAITEHSAGRAIVFAGDFNTPRRRPEHHAALLAFKDALQLQNSSIHPSHEDRRNCQVDFILLRDGDAVSLDAVSLDAVSLDVIDGGEPPATTPGAGPEGVDFCDGDSWRGRALNDHPSLAVKLEIRSGR